MPPSAYDPPQDGDSNAKLPAEDARQGQNIKGMVWVLIIGVALVVVAFAVMIALQSEPVTTDNREASSTLTPPPASTDAGQLPETAKSPQ